MENYLNEKTYDIDASTQDSIRGDEESVKVRSQLTERGSGKTFSDETDEGTIKDPKNGKSYDYSHEYIGDKQSTNKQEGEFKIGNNLSGQGPYGVVTSKFVRGAEEARYSIVKGGKKKELGSTNSGYKYSDFLKELMKATGISFAGLEKINKLIMNPDLPGIKGVVDATKVISKENVQESFSRGCLYRKKYFGRY